MKELTSSKDYRQFIVSIKQRVQASQIKAAMAVNCELLGLYWFLGDQILEKQQSVMWGDGFMKQMSQDLLTEFPEMKGFSYRNLKSIRQWYGFWSGEMTIGKQPVSQLEAKGKQLVSQIPWGYNILTPW